MNYKDDKSEMILLTGCIDPGGMIFTKLQDPVLRKNQYIDAIRFYLKNTELPILFVENSGNDVSHEFKNEINNGRLEILTFNGNNYNKSLGKGFGEMLIIERALQKSQLIKKACFIFKITGRYIILNIKELIQWKRKYRSEIFADINKILPSDSRFWGAQNSFYTDILLSYKNEIDDSKGMYFEHALFNAIQQATTKGYSHSVLPVLPRFSGINATDNKAFKSSWFIWSLKNIKHKLGI